MKEILRLDFLRFEIMKIYCKISVFRFPELLGFKALRNIIILATGAMPARQLHQISAIVENSSWNHIKANRFPGLVARSIRTRLGSRRRPKLKTVQSCQNPTDSEPYDFSHISLPKVC